MIQGGRNMTIEAKIELLRQKLAKDDKKYDLIGIYEDEHAFKCYSGHMDPWCNDRHMIYPVSWNKEIKTMGSFLAGHVSAFFFGTQFLNDEDFKNKVIDTLSSSKYVPEKIKIYAYKIVN